MKRWAGVVSGASLLSATLLAPGARAELTVTDPALPSPGGTKTSAPTMVSSTSEILPPNQQPVLVTREQNVFGPPAGSQVVGAIFFEDFEAAFPGSAWTLYGSPTWGVVSNSAHGGSFSAWCAGSALSPSEGYANNMAAWMIYGPFSLSDALGARVRFCYRNNSELGADVFKWLASNTGIYYYGQSVSGGQDTWVTNTFDLSNVSVLGNLCGQSQVWLAFLFKSNSTNSGPAYTGAFVDDIVLEKTVLNPLPQIRVEPLTLLLSNAVSVFVSNTGSPVTNATSSSPAVAAGTPAGQKLIGMEEIMKPLQAGELKTKVIVSLRSPAFTPKVRDWNSRAALQALRDTVRLAQDEVLSALPPSEFKLRHRFQNQAGFSAEVSSAALAALVNHPQVASIEPVRLLQPHLAQGIPLMNGLAYRSVYTGAGVAIAVCDTGIDYTHPRLGGGGFPNSKVLGGYDFGDNAPDPMPQGQPHGTCCAGIAAGDLGTVGDYIGGVACGAKLYALKISPGGTAGATSDTMVAAWDWCVTHKNDNPDFPILAISTSFGGGRAFSFCDEQVPAMATAASNAVAAGITVLASAGNDGFCDSIGWPACNSDVISVGAVYDAAFGNYSCCLDASSCVSKTATTGCTTGFYTTDTAAPDKVPSYSNIAPFLALLAPANAAYVPDIVGTLGYDRGDYYSAFGGTSAACPYAAGAVACLQSAAKTNLGRFLTPAEVRAVLLSTGEGVTDLKAALTKPRVNLGHAIQSVQPGFTIYNDGGSILTVTSIVPEVPAPWLSLSASAPFTVPVGGAQGVSVKVDFNAAPLGHSSLRLWLYSDDGTKSPYPDGVNLIIENAAPVPPSITDICIAEGTNVLISFISLSNRLYTLEQQTDLAAGVWSAVLTNVLATNSTMQIAHPNGLGPSARFYRIGLQP